MTKYKNIRDLREDHDLKQQDLADYLNTTQKTYSRYETGERNIPTEVLIELANYYSVSVDYLLDLTSHKEPYPPKKSSAHSPLFKK